MPSGLVRALPTGRQAELGGCQATRTLRWAIASSTENERNCRCCGEAASARRRAGDGRIYCRLASGQSTPGPSGGEPTQALVIWARVMRWRRPRPAWRAGGPAARGGGGTAGRPAARRGGEPVGGVLGDEDAVRIRITFLSTQVGELGTDFVAHIPIRERDDEISTGPMVMAQPPSASAIKAAGAEATSCPAGRTRKLHSSWFQARCHGAAIRARPLQEGALPAPGQSQR